MSLGDVLIFSGVSFTGGEDLVLKLRSKAPRGPNHGSFVFCSPSPTSASCESLAEMMTVNEQPHC